MSLGLNPLTNDRVRTIVSQHQASNTYRPPSSPSVPFPFPFSSSIPNTKTQTFRQRPSTQTTTFVNKSQQDNSYKQQLLSHTTATMSSPYTVQIHQSNKEPSISSSYSYSSGSYSSSGSTTPRSLSPGEYREYGAGKLPATESPGSLIYLGPTLTIDTYRQAHHTSRQLWPELGHQPQQSRVRKGLARTKILRRIHENISDRRRLPPFIFPMSFFVDFEQRYTTGTGNSIHR